MNFSGKMWLMIILKVPKIQDLTLSLEDAFLKKPKEGVKLTPPPPSPSLSMGPLSLSKVNSNNTPQPLKQIPESISKRAWKNLSSKDTFENSKTLYEKYLNNSGLEEKLNHHQGHRSKNQNIKIKKAQHEIILLNLLFSKTVKMNVGYKFLQFINRHFPKQPGNILGN